MLEAPGQGALEAAQVDVGRHRVRALGGDLLEHEREVVEGLAQRRALPGDQGVGAAQRDVVDAAEVLDVEVLVFHGAVDAAAGAEKKLVQRLLHLGEAMVVQGRLGLRSHV